LKVELHAAVTGLKEVLSPIKLEVGAGEAQVAGWDVTAPDDVSELKYNVEAAVTGGPSDKLAVAQKVISPVPVRTYQATLRRLDKPFDEQAAIPSDAIPGRGGLLLAESST